MEKRLYFRERGLELRKVYNLEKGVYSGERSLTRRTSVLFIERYVKHRMVCVL